MWGKCYNGDAIRQSIKLQEPLVAAAWTVLTTVTFLPVGLMSHSASYKKCIGSSRQASSTRFDPMDPKLSDIDGSPGWGIIGIGGSFRLFKRVHPELDYLQVGIRFTGSIRSMKGSMDDN